MTNIAFLPIAPVVIIALGAVLVLMAAVTIDLGRRAWAIIAGVALAVSFGFAWVQWENVDGMGSQLYYAGDFFRTPMVVMDYFSVFGGGLVVAAGAIAMLGGWRLVGSLEKRGAEYVALALLAIAGLQIMVISANLILMFIGLETASIALYIIAGFTRDQENSDEAATKYFLLGSFASALFLYGIALSNRPLLLFGVLLILVGVQLLSLGLVAEMTARTYYEAQQRPPYYVRNRVRLGAEEPGSQDGPRDVQ